MKSIFDRSNPWLSLYIAIGGAIGTFFRALTNEIWYKVCRKTNTSTMSCEILFRIWPYSTLLINTTACFLFGIIVEIRDKRKEMLPHGLEEILLIGLFGGYSTLSTFAFQVYDMFVCQRYLLAIGYIIVTNAIAILAVWAGVVLIRFVLSESVQAPSSPSEVSPGTLRSR